MRNSIVSKAYILAASALLTIAGSKLDAVVPASCRASVPPNILPGKGSWIGPCRGGHADGNGTLRVVSSTGTRLFFGRMSKGRPYRGVMTFPNGDWLPAWRFDQRLRPFDLAKAPPSNELSAGREYVWQTLDAAAAGAMAASDHYRVRGNAASARYYAAQSRSFAEAGE